MDKELYDMFKEINNLNIKRYKIIKEEYQYIRHNNIKDEHKLESLLDNLLDIVYNDKVAKLYIDICLYYHAINPEHANEYYQFYLEEINENKKELSLKKENNKRQ